MAFTRHIIPGFTSGVNLSSYSFTRDVPAGVNLLVVSVSTRFGASNSVTVGGNALAQLDEHNAGPGGQPSTHIWYIANPPTGSGVQFDVNSGGNASVVGIVAYEDADLVNPFGAVAKGAFAAGSPSVNVASAAGDDVIDVVACYGANTAATPDASQTQVHVGQSADIGGGMSAEAAVGASTTMSWSTNPNLNTSIMAVAVKPAAGGGSPIAGSGTAALPVPQAAGSGAVLVSGSGTAALPVPQAAGAGAVRVAGSGSAALPAPSGSGSGAAEVAGSGTAALPVPQAAGAGAVRVAGSGSAALPAPSGSGSGAVLVSGSGAASLPVPQAAGSGAVLITGQGTAVLPAPRGQGSSVQPVAGSGSAALPAPSGSGSGAVRIAAAGASTLGVPQATGSGAVRVQGAGTCGLPAPQAEGLGAVLIAGQGGVQVPAPIAAGFGAVRIFGSGVAVLPAIVAQGSSLDPVVHEDNVFQTAARRSSASVSRRVTSFQAVKHHGN